MEKDEMIPEGYKASNEEEAIAIANYNNNQNQISWIMASYIIFVHILGLASLSTIQQCKTETLMGAFALYILGGFGITAGAHRLYSHQSYQAAWPYRWFIMILGSIANQGTILHWARDHRTHHKYSETRADPHCALRGFFFAHVGWLLVKKDPRVIFAGRNIPTDDLKALPELRFQSMLDPWFSLGCCFVFPMLASHYLWNETLYNGFMVMGVAKYICTLHGTWCVNSLAHLYGSHPYDEHSNPAESPFASAVALGEGWHNYHHAFPSDYSTSEFGASYQFNPTRILIDTAAAIGLVWDRKSASRLCEMRLKNKETKIIGPPLFRRRI